MTKELISVCMPVFNGEKFIAESVKSILSQTHRDFEFIIIDDGSTDRTVEIISGFKESRIKLIQNKVNKGNIFRRNEAFKIAEGDFIAIMDADDVSISERLFLQKETLKKGFDICGGWVANCNNSLLPAKYWRIPKLSDQLKRLCLFGSPIPNPTAMISREFLEKYKFSFNEEFYPAADYFGWAKSIFIDEARAFGIQQPLTFKRIHDNSISEINKQKQRKKHEDVQRYLLEKLEISDYYIDLHIRSQKKEALEKETALLGQLYCRIIDSKSSILDENGTFYHMPLKINFRSQKRNYTEHSTEIKVSIIVPAYNVESYIEESISSIFQNKMREFEVIIINDGSTDKTLNEIKKLQEFFGQRIKFINQENRGLSAARNLGIKEAKGQYVYFMDSDDYLDPGLIDVLYASAFKYNTDVTLPGHTAFYMDGREPETILAINKDEIFEKDIFHHYSLRKFGYIAHNKMIRATLAKKLLFKEGIYHEDELFCPELFLRAKKVSLCSEILYNYRKRDGSITSATTKKHFLDWLNITKNVHSLMVINSDQISRTSFLRIMDYYFRVSKTKLKKLGEDTKLERELLNTWSEIETQMIKANFKHMQFMSE